MKEDAAASQLLRWCDKFGQRVSERSVLVGVGFISLKKSNRTVGGKRKKEKKEKVQVDIVFVPRRDLMSL